MGVTDLDRLRRYADWLRLITGSHRRNILDEAADEIERLRAAREE